MPSISLSLAQLFVQMHSLTHSLTTRICRRQFSPACVLSRRVFCCYYLQAFENEKNSLVARLFCRLYCIECKRNTDENNNSCSRSTNKLIGALLLLFVLSVCLFCFCYFFVSSLLGCSVISSFVKFAYYSISIELSVGAWQHN